MKSYLYHLQINIDWAHIAFYKDLMAILGWFVIFEKENDVIGYRSEHNGDLWIVTADQKEQEDYDAIGLNHIAFRTENINDIKEVEQFLRTQNLSPLFGTPRHRPEFAPKEDETYYQLIFVSLDNIQFEIVYIGPKN